jgi:ribosome recycling factor
MNDGKVIRINVPPLTAERRRDLVKIIKKMAEETKVAARNIRRDANEMIKDLKKEKEISEDDQFRAQEETQKITDEFIKKIDALYGIKEKEILEI